ncbi:MAG: hypothetical protein HUJ26_17230 [Planctomycetaceae bacterium]|nr:hypothetical protein [Planctomycetaceae bacterium]
MQILLKQLMTLQACLICLITVGCGGSGGDGPELFPVTGTVTFDGEPVSEGRILFRADGGAGKGYAGEIKEGTYTVETVAGDMTVEIVASREVPGKFGEAASPDEEPPPLMEMYIPEKYNTKTTLTATVSDGENTIPFELEP